MEKCGKNMEKQPFFRAATAGLGKYRTGGYGRIGVYRVQYLYQCIIYIDTIWLLVVPIYTIDI